MIATDQNRADRMPTYEELEAGGVCAVCRGTGKQRITRGWGGPALEVDCDRCLGRGITAAEWKAQHAEEIAALPTMGDFGRSLAEKVEKWGTLTDRQLAAVQRILAERAADAEDPAPAPVPVGRGRVTGVVRTLREQESAYGWQWKMRVVDDRGFRVWSTVPAAIVEEVKLGDRVSFVGTLTASKDDETFGFASRPAAANIV